jgi:hypothetical protein
MKLMDSIIERKTLERLIKNGKNKLPDNWMNAKCTFDVNSSPVLNKFQNMANENMRKLKSLGVSDADMVSMLKKSRMSNKDISDVLEIYKTPDADISSCFNKILAREFEDHLIADTDFDIQEAYIKALCFLANKFNEITDEQQYILDSLVLTINSDMDTSDYIEEAEDLDEDEINDLLTSIRSDDSAYNFIVDMLLIAKLGKECDSIDEIVDFCHDAICGFGISENDGKAIYILVRSIYSESDSLYYKVKDLNNRNLCLDDFKCYTDEYVN